MQLVQIPWVPLTSGEIPLPNQLAWWYDSMFNNIMVFSLQDPSKHDGDFTHWLPLVNPYNETAGYYNSEFQVNRINTRISHNKNSAKKRLIAVKIAKALPENGMNRKNFAAIMNASPSVITKWLSGTHNFTIETLFEIESKLKINLFNYL